ncbi:MAG TPA: hypothetical protein VF676_03215 [Flavobacterium sp.]|jgi:hypothetical protein
MIKLNKKHYITLGLAFLLGAAEPFLNVGVSLILFLLTVLVIFSCVTILIVAMFVKGVRNSAAIAVIISLTYVITIYTSSKIVEVYRKDLAQNIVDKLETFYVNNGYYPQTLNNLNVDDIEGLEYYYVDGNYRMTYKKDGINTVSYDNFLKKWENY